MYTFARWVGTPENSSARMAVQRVAEALCSRLPERDLAFLFLHGPSGTGKTHLVSALVNEATRRVPNLVVASHASDELALLLRPDFVNEPEDSAQQALASLIHSDLLIVEDLQHLPPLAASALARVIDERLARPGQTVFTAAVGPGELVKLPARLTSRLASGLVVGLMPLTPAGRLAFLRERAQKKHLVVGDDVLAWLAENVGSSGRQLEGAILRLDTILRQHARVPDLATVAGHFQVEATAAQPTVERITQRVGRFFQVDPKHMLSKRRSHNALLPRQVSMYLARRLTPLSLGQIGAFFGGRDHTTVLHACRKVEQALTEDAGLSGAVRRLHADLA